MVDSTQSCLDDMRPLGASSAALAYLSAALLAACSADPTTRVLQHEISTFRDTLSDNTQGPMMVKIPAGSFLMGSEEGEKGRYANEGPQTLITISEPFAVGRYEVTWAEWEACVAGGGCLDNSDKKNNPFMDDERVGDAGFGRGRRPVINVDWNDAKAYVLWLSQETGKPYRLLSESEWEYVARAGTDTLFYWGDNPDGGCKHANGSDLDAKVEDRSWTTSNRSDGYGRNTAPVGSFSENAFGLHDMFGNVDEWTEDCLSYDLENIPVDGTPFKDGDCNSHMHRGSSFGGYPRILRSANRSSALSNSRFADLGFRVARDLN